MIPDARKGEQCDDCFWWAGYSGKGTDFGMYAPCVCEESPSFLKVTHIAHTCDELLVRSRWGGLSDEVQDQLMEKGYTSLTRTSR